MRAAHTQPSHPGAHATAGACGSQRHGSTPNRRNLEAAQYPPAGAWAEETALKTKRMNDSDIQQNASTHPQYWVKKNTRPNTALFPLNFLGTLVKNQ